jgi:thiamine pyrophosphokinase
VAGSVPGVSTTVVVVTGGDPVAAETVAGLSGLFVVAADSGLDHAESVGLEPSLVVGDFDSVSADALSRYSGPVERHPVAKDATDLELALRAAVSRHPDRIVVVGGHGGRIDHLIANALVLTTVPAGIDVEWRAGASVIHIVRRECSITGTVGQTVSLVPVGGDAVGVTTSGLEWPLDDETLAFGTTRGVSNALLAPEARISLREGTLLVMLPGQS